MKNKRLVNNKGTTLVEVLMASLIFAIAITALLSSAIATFGLLETSKNQTLALSDIRSLLERIRATPYSNMLINFPNGTLDGPVGNKYYTSLGGNYSISSEHMNVTYASITADPLEVKVQSNWTDRFGRSDSVDVSTYKTR